MNDYKIQVSDIFEIFSESIELVLVVETKLQSDVNM